MTKQCADCAFADGADCLRDGRYKQSYETFYGDSDFCGPTRRYFKAASLFQRITRRLRQ